MKKLLFSVLAGLSLFVACTQYDDTAIVDRIDNLESRVNALEKLQTQMEELKALVKAIENKDYVTAVTPILEGGVQVGYAIVFTQSGTIEIRNGANGNDGRPGTDGEDGSVVSIKQDTDGIYYWTIDGEFTNPKLRVDGATPQFKIDEEAYLCVSYDGKNWERLGKTGATVDSGYKVEYDEDNVYITFIDDETTVTLPRLKEFALGIAKNGGIGIKAGATVSIPYVINQGDETVQVETISENGYRAEVIKTDLTSGEIKVTAPTPFVEGKVLVFANKGDKTCMKALHFEAETFTMSTTAYEVGDYGGELVVELLSNLEFTVEIPESDTWIHHIATKADLMKLTFAVDGNTGEARTSTITLRGTDGTELMQFTIAQDGSVEHAIEALFGYQIYEDETHGFTKDANFTMAVIGNYLILSNSKNIDEMPVYDRMTGELLPEVKINTEGIDCKDREFRAITTDDAGHLFAVAYTTTLDEDAANDIVRAYVWKNGIDQKPTSFMYADIKGSTYANAPYGVNGVKAMDIYNTVKVYGDLTADAVIATSSWKNLRPVFQFVKDGKLEPKAYVYWPGGGATASMGAMTTVVPLSYPDDLTAPKNLEYFWNVGNHNQQQVYVNNSTNAITLNRASSHIWAYDKGVQYQRPSLGFDAIRINGTIIAAMHNASYQATSTAGKFKYASRMYVANLGNTPSANSWNDGFIFDTREGDLKGDESKGGPAGTGYGPKGMTSPTSYETGKTVLAENDNEAFYVLLAPGADGHSVQAYMLAQNNGLFAYTIPFSKF